MNGLELRDTLAVLRDGPEVGRDDYNAPIPGPPGRTTIPAQVDAPDRKGGEDNAGRDTAVAYYDVTAGPDADVRHLDRVEWRGQAYEVDGAPVLHGHGRHLAHLTFVMKRVTE